MFWLQTAKWHASVFFVITRVLDIWVMALNVLKDAVVPYLLNQHDCTFCVFHISCQTTTKTMFRPSSSTCWLWLILMSQDQEPSHDQYRCWHQQSLPMKTLLIPISGQPITHHKGRNLLSSLMGTQLLGILVTARPRRLPPAKVHDGTGHFWLTWL